MQCSASIKHLCLDHGGEYLSNKFTHHLKAQGTERELTTCDILQHNGVVECLNCMLVEQVCMVLHASRLLKTLWAEAISHIIWVKNRSVTCALDSKTPYEMLYQMKLNIANLCTYVPTQVHKLAIFSLCTCVGKQMLGAQHEQLEA